MLSQQGGGGLMTESVLPVGGGQINGADRNGAWASYRQGHAAAPLHHSIRNRRQFDFSGNRVDYIDWRGEQLIPVRKCFTNPHPDVDRRSTSECDMLRLKSAIEVHSSQESLQIPKPITKLEEAPFPDWAAEILRSRMWEEPTPIQMQAWPVALDGYDLVGIASTGSGKTMAYILPMLVHIIAQPELKPGEGPVGLVLLPTRELSWQVRDEIAMFSDFTDIHCESVFGGEDFESQGRKMLEKVDVVTATPGRLISLLAERRTNLKRVTYVVIDEADALLDQSFEGQVMDVLSQVRPDRQVLLFSATFQDQVEKFAMKCCEDKQGLSPGTIQINVGGIKLSACKDIDQQFWSPGESRAPGQAPEWVVGETKAQVLCRALGMVAEKLKQEGQKALVFCNRPQTIPGVVEAIRNIGLSCEGFTGECTMAVREEVLGRFRDPDADLSILVCTSILGRGHDFHNVMFVVNYDMPNRIVDYIHRIGRTGRRGRKGFALTLLEKWDLRFAKDLVDCLQETKHKPDHWLKEAARKNSKYWREYHNFRRGLGGVEGDAGGAACWAGRGLGKRRQFLLELNGRGVARGIPDSEI